MAGLALWHSMTLSPELSSPKPCPGRGEKCKESARTSGGAEKWLDDRLWRPKGHSAVILMP